jgi:hypothetical protein
MGKRFPGKSPGVWKSGKVLWKTSGKCADVVAKHTDFAGVHLFFAIFCGEQGFVGVGKGGIVFNRVWNVVWKRVGERGVRGILCGGLARSAKRQRAAEV